MIYDLGSGYFVRGLLPADLDGPYPSWFDDQEVCRYNTHGKFFRPPEYFRRYVEAAEQDDRVVWAICHRTDGHIGNVALQQISQVNQSAEFAIILGDKRHWGKGVGKLAGTCLLRHGFLKLNLHRVYCGTAAPNEGMIRLARAMHMSEEGRRREALFLEGVWVDVLEFGVLRDHFLSAAGAAG